MNGLRPRPVGTVKPMPIPHKLAALAAAAALCLPVAACGEDDVDQARKDVQEQADKLKGNLDDLSKDDLRNAIDARRTRPRKAARTRSERPASSRTRSSAS